jgi:hypothetical protein
VIIIDAQISDAFHGTKRSIGDGGADDGGEIGGGDG